MALFLSKIVINEASRLLGQGPVENAVALVFAESKLADRVVVLEHGEILEEGSHAELMPLEGRYHTCLPDKPAAIYENSKLRRAWIYCLGAVFQVFDNPTSLSGEDVLPGFQLNTADIS